MPKGDNPKKTANQKKTKQHERFTNNPNFYKFLEQKGLDVSNQKKFTNSPKFYDFLRKKGVTIAGDEQRLLEESNQKQNRKEGNKKTHREKLKNQHPSGKENKLPVR